MITIRPKYTMVSFLAVISSFKYINCIKRVALRTTANRKEWRDERKTNRLSHGLPYKTQDVNYCSHRLQKLSDIFWSISNQVWRF